MKRDGRKKEEEIENEVEVEVFEVLTDLPLRRLSDLSISQGPLTSSTFAVRELSFSFFSKFPANPQEYIY